MCGVIGFHSPFATIESIEILQRLYAQSKVRGLHSFGYAATDGNLLTLDKFHRLDDLQSKLEQLAGKPLTLIGHNRYSTSGNWHDHDNNQPIVKQRSTLVFNGVIDMRQPIDWQQAYGGNFDTHNDGEIFLNWLNSGQDPVAFLKQYPCSFAGLFMQDGQAWALRNRNRPLWMLKRDGAVFVASTQDIFRRAIGADVEPISVKPLQVVSLKQELAELAVKP